MSNIVNTVMDIMYSDPRNVERHLVSKPKVLYTNTESQTFSVIIKLALFHIALMAFSIPYMICTPDGCNPSGYLKTISDGIRDHTVLTSTLWGAGMNWITATRYMGLTTCSFFYACICHVCIVIIVYTSILTIRYDVVQSEHVSAAISWIVASFLFHFCVTIKSSVQWQWIPIVVFIVGCFFGSVYVIMFSMVVVYPSFYGNIALSVISLFEVACVISINILDGLQCLELLNKKNE